MTNKEFVAKWREKVRSPNWKTPYSVLGEALDRLEAIEARTKLAYSQGYHCGVMEGKSYHADCSFEKCFLNSPLYVDGSVPAPQTSAERDYTPEEALAEARRRWPSDPIGVFVECFLNTYRSGEIKTNVFRVGEGADFHGDAWIHFQGESFRAAFAEADKAPKTGGERI